MDVHIDSVYSCKTATNHTDLFESLLRNLNIILVVRAQLCFRNHS